MVSPWREVTQDAITQFADITGDRQWIHVDVERARRESPFGGTIAHGFFTLSLIQPVVARRGRRHRRHAHGHQLRAEQGAVSVAVAVRLAACAARCTLQQLDPADGGVQATWNVVIERDGSAKPCCVAEWLVRYLLVDGTLRAAGPQRSGHGKRL